MMWTGTESPHSWLIGYALPSTLSPLAAGRPAKPSSSSSGRHQRSRVNVVARSDSGSSASCVVKLSHTPRNRFHERVM